MRRNQWSRSSERAGGREPRTNISTFTQTSRLFRGFRGSGRFVGMQSYVPRNSFSVERSCASFECLTPLGFFPHRRPPSYSSVRGLDFPQAANAFFPPAPIDRRSAQCKSLPNRHRPRMPARWMKARMKRRGEWIRITIEDALNRHSDKKMRCPACHGRVKALPFSINGVGAHFEHYANHAGCPRGDSYSGAPSPHPDAL
jgi:hypothetical protein